MRKLLVALILPIVALLSVGTASAATAAEPAAVVQTVAVGDIAHTNMIPDGCSRAAGCNGVSVDERDNQYSQSFYLPINRWQDMAFHSRVNWWNLYEAGNAVTGRALTGSLMNAGNGLWKTSTDWSRMAMDFKPLETDLGYTVDRMSGVIGNALKNQPVLLASIFVLLLGIVFWRAMRGAGSRPIGKIIRAAFVLALVVFMGTQAFNSTAKAPTGSYKPLPFTPVYLAGATTGTVENIAGAVVGGISGGLLPMVTSQAGEINEEGTGKWSCSAAIDAAFTYAKLKDAPSAGGEAVIMAMNSMWIATGYNIYTVAQFGDSNPYAKEVACRQLERTTSADAFTRARIISQATTGSPYTYSHTKSGQTPLSNMTYPVWQNSEDNEVNDAAMMFWAACAPNDSATKFTPRGGWSEFINDEDCKGAWNAKTGDELKRTKFNIADTEALLKQTDNPAVFNFVNTLQGRDLKVSMGGSLAAGIIYVIGSFVAFLIFGVLALAVVASKLFMLLLTAFMFVVLLISLFKNDSIAETIQKPAYQFLGVTVFAFGSSLLLALLSMITLMFASLSTVAGSAGSIGALLWVSFSPVVAIMAIHFLFTKMFKMPSPVTPKGALAWGTAGGAIGGAVGAGLMNRIQSGGKRMAKGAGESVLRRTKAGRFFMGEVGKERKGAGDAGTRGGLGKLSSDTVSEQTRQRDDQDRIGTGETYTKDNGAELLAATQEELESNTRYLSKGARAKLEREAKDELRATRREAKDAARDASRQEKLDARTERQQARAALLAEHVAANGGDASLLSAKAREAMGAANKSGLDDMSAASWSDLSAAGKRKAAMLAAKNAAKNTTAKVGGAAGAAKEGVKTLGQRDTWRGAWTDIKNEGAAAKNTVVGAAKNPRQAARAAVDATRNAARATADAPRKAAEAMRSDKFRTNARRAVAVAGVATSIVAAPVGVAMVGGAVISKVRGSKASRAEAKQREQVEMNQLMLVKLAEKRQQAAPGTSTVSDAPPKTAKKD